MNILFVHEIDWLKKVVFEIHNLSESLSLRGHKVYAIDYENMWEKDSYSFFGSLKTKEVEGISRAIPGASVILRRPGFIRFRFLSRLSASITHYKEIKRTIMENSIDAIVLYSVPTNGLQTIHLAKKFGIPVVFRSIDILHQLVPNAVLRALTKIIERKVYSQSDLVLPNTPRYLQYVLNMGASESNVKLLLLPIDTSIFHPSIDSSEVLQKWGFSQKDQIVLFIGTLFKFCGLERFIRRFPEVIENIPDAKLLIVGDGPQRLELERIISELCLERFVIITGFQPYQTMPQYINLAAVCVNTFLNTGATRDIFPGKIVQYIACGRPTVVTSLPSITTLLPMDSHGVIFADSINDMVKEVISLLRSPERRKRLEQAGINYVRQAHEQQKIADLFEEELMAVIRKKSGSANPKRL